MEYILASTWERLLKLFHSMVSPNTQNVIHLARRIWTTDLRISDCDCLLQSSALPAELSRAVLCLQELLWFYSQMCMRTYFLKQSHSEILKSVVQIRLARWESFFIWNLFLIFKFFLKQHKLVTYPEGVHEKCDCIFREADLNHRPKDIWLWLF